MRATPRRGTDHAFPLLRPPGAIAEPDFLAVCTRCGDCSDACPHDAIREAAPRLREAAGTPILEPALEPCQLCEDLPCIAACETGALRPEAPAVLGTARIQPLDCLNNLSSTCSVCLERCPVPGAMAFEGAAPVVVEALCTGCGVCQHVCPAPHNAVAILPNPERPTRDQLEASAVASAAVAVGEGRGEGEGVEPIALPALHEGVLDDDGLRALFRDLEALATIDEVRLKHAADRRAADSARPADALQLLLDRGIRGVQLRYRYAGESWCDTILSTATGHRVVRLADPARPTGHA